MGHLIQKTGEDQYRVWSTVVDAFIELMIVIGIIAIVAAIAVPNLIASQHVHHYRYHISTQHIWHDTDTIERLPDGGIRFVNEQGKTIEVHGSFEIADSQPQAEAR